MSEVITQVSDEAPEMPMEALPEVFYLDLRGQKFRLSRETLLGLPESIVYSFSGGFGMISDAYVHHPQSEQHEHVNSSNESFYQSPRDDGFEMTLVDFNPVFLNYVLDMYHKHADRMKPPFIPLGDFPEFRGFVEAHATTAENPDSSVPELALEPQILMDPDHTPKVLKERPSLVVLKEDIEYYCMAPVTGPALQHIKRKCGEYLVSQKSIFEDILRTGHVFRPKLSPTETGGTTTTELPGHSPEYHLVQMLNLAGIDKEANWHIREREPHKTTVTSLQLSPLRVPKDGDLEAIQAVQKLLLFWKKPARKCWWSELALKIDDVDVKVHVRKVWTLELSILGIKV